VYDQVESRVERQQLREKLDTLTRRERLVLELRYGLQDGIERTQREIARFLGVSRSYVSRIEKRALHKLGQAMGA